MGIRANPDGSKTLRCGTRTVTLLPADFVTAETDAQLESRISGAGKLMLQREVTIKIFSRVPLVTAIRLAPPGSVAPAEWWDLKVRAPAGLLAKG